ncbi:MAG: response regulator [Coleofasciculaceae cyanobacterium]
MKILLVEDDEPTAWALNQALSSHHYVVTIATDGQIGLELAQAFTYDLLLLDIMVPKIDGITLCRQLRSGGYQSPILLLTALDSNSDRVMGLDAGADDYIVKPFDLEELMARIRALLRRPNSTLPSILSWGKLRFDTNINQVSYGEKIIRLTPKEYSLIKLFLLNPQRVFSRRIILDRLWSEQEAPGEETITTHVKNLRQKLKTAGASAGFIEKVYGLGYRLQPLSELDAQESFTKAVSAPSFSQKEQKETRLPEERLQDSLSKMWQKYESTFRNQLEVITLTNTALKEDKLTESLRQKAKQEAHRLAGSLGIFGFAEGSKLARLLEQLLDIEGAISQAQAGAFSQYVGELQQMLSQAPPALSVTTTTIKTSSSPRILVIDDDVTLTQLLKSEAKAWTMEVEVALDLKTARIALAKKSPDLILLDLNFADSAQDGLSLLQEQANLTPKIPILAFTNSDQLTDRVEVARLGGCGFLQKPISPTQIFTIINNILKRTFASETKVMVVDDDSNILATLSRLLKVWGIEVITLETAQNFWKVLLAEAPDLLILDLEMPRFSGIDLCQVVRNDPHWHDLPIVFFTSHTETHIIERMFAAGADDYICKSVVEQELMSRIFNRLKRISRRKQIQKN